MNHDELIAFAHGQPDRPTRLLYLETRDREISAVQHELQRQRTKNREEATRLRIDMTSEERRLYDDLKLEEVYR